MQDSKKYTLYLEDLRSVCERRDCLLIMHYNWLLREMPGYEPKMALEGLRASIVADLGFARDCAVKRDFWTMQKDLDLVQTSLKAIRN